MDTATRVAIVVKIVLLLTIFSTTFFAIGFDTATHQRAAEVDPSIRRIEDKLYGGHSEEQPEWPEVLARLNAIAARLND